LDEHLLALKHTDAFSGILKTLHRQGLAVGFSPELLISMRLEVGMYPTSVSRGIRWDFKIHSSGSVPVPMQSSTYFWPILQDPTNAFSGNSRAILRCE
jgi:hypothetical protein